MKGIIVLRGIERTGKTTTMGIVCDILTKEEKCEELEKRICLGREPDDFECVIKYKDVRVAIYSEGDYPNELVKKIEEYAERCDIFVCPEKMPKGKLRKEERIAEYNKLHEAYKRFKYIVIDKTQDENSMEEANKADAKKIICVMNCMIDKINGNNKPN